MLNTKAKLAEEEAMLLTQKTSDKEMEIHRVKMAAMKVKGTEAFHLRVQNRSKILGIMQPIYKYIQ